MPTHKDKPEGFDEAAARRSAELDAAIERARAEREARYVDRRRAEDVARRATSVAPPG